MNRVILTGTIAKGSSRPFTTESGKQKVEFRLYDGKLHHSVVTWEDVAKAVPAEESYVFVEGRLGYRSYEKDGNKVWVTEITASTVETLSGGATDNAPEGDLGF